MNMVVCRAQLSPLTLKVAGIWKAEERWRAITSAIELKNLLGREYPRSVM
jgi:hypothetical protein